MIASDNCEKPSVYEKELESSFQTVLKESDELYQTGGRLFDTYERFTRRLSDLSVSYSLVGGYALIVHGVRRFTEDVDFLVTDEGLKQIRENLLGKGYVTIPGNTRNIRDAETGVRIEFVVTGQYPGDGKPKPVVFPDPSDVSENIDHVTVVGLGTLIELKLASGMTGKGRIQDLADVQRLIAQHDLTEEYAINLHEYVRDKFLEILRS